MRRIILFLFSVIYCFQLFGQVQMAQEITDVVDPKEDEAFQLLIEQLKDRADADTLLFEEIEHLLQQLDTVINDIPRPSKIYGIDLLKSDSLSFIKEGQLSSVPNSYIVGTGDEIAVSVFGISQLDVLLEVDQEGSVKATDMPKIFLKGLTWGQAKQLLRRRFGNYYRFRPDQFAASIIKPRSTTVNVVGEVNQAGSYRMEATNTVFNAIVAAKGVNENASLRNIRVFDDQGKRSFDLYEYLTGDFERQNIYLEDNATVQVPPAGKIVTITGAITRPMMYELKDGEGLQSLITYAGGFTGDAAKEIIQIERYIDDQKQVLDILIADLNRQKVALERGDVISVRQGSEELRNVVYIEGAVNFEGPYELRSTQKISELIKKGKLLPTAKVDQGFLLRMNPDSTVVLLEISLEDVIKNPENASNLSLQDGDRLIINDEVTYSDQADISIKGAVRKEASYVFDPNSNISLYQMIMLSGGAQDDVAEQGYIVRSNPSNLTEKEYISINVKGALIDPQGPANVVLHPWDEVILLSATQDSDISYVSVSGEVRRPKRIVYAPSLGVQDVLRLSGGLLPQASHEIKIYRVVPSQDGQNRTEELVVQINDRLEVIEPQDLELQPNDKVVVMSVPRYEEQSLVTVEGAVVSVGTIGLTVSDERISSVIHRAGGLTNEALSYGSYILRNRNSVASGKDMSYDKIAIRLDLALADPGGLHDLPLIDGDKIIIPKNNGVVYILLENTMGGGLDTTTNAIGAPHQAGKDAKWYIDNYAGGVTQQADKKSITVQQANGAKVATTKGLFKMKYPVPERGATIYVGQKVEIIKEPKSDTNKGVIINVGGESKPIQEGTTTIQENRSGNE